MHIHIFVSLLTLGFGLGSFAASQTTAKSCLASAGGVCFPAGMTVRGLGNPVCEMNTENLPIDKSTEAALNKAWVDLPTLCKQDSPLPSTEGKSELPIDVVFQYLARFQKPGAFDLKNPDHLRVATAVLNSNLPQKYPNLMPAFLLNIANADMNGHLPLAFLDLFKNFEGSLVAIRMKMDQSADNCQTAKDFTGFRRMAQHYFQALKEVNMNRKPNLDDWKSLRLFRRYLPRNAVVSHIVGTFASKTEAEKAELERRISDEIILETRGCETAMCDGGL